MKHGCTTAVHRAGFFGLGLLGVGGSRVVNLKFPENIASLSGVQIRRKRSISLLYSRRKWFMLFFVRVAEISPVNDRQVASLRAYLANA
jgi:hypothetical protein